MDKASKKSALKAQCMAQLDARRAAIDARLAQLSTSLQEETKSSAGDKHETGRAMVQLEREKAGQQLAEIEKLQHIGKRLSTVIKKGPAHLGCVVETTKSNYYLSVPAGALSVTDQTYFGIAIGSPIGQLLLGKSEGATIVFRESSFTITSIY